MSGLSRSAIGLVLLIVGSGVPRGGCWSPAREGGSYRIKICDVGHSLSSKEADKEMDTLFEKAVASYGQDYVQVEKTLLRGGESTAATLRRNLDNTDPVARIMAQCLLDRVEGRAPDYQAALDYLDYIPKRLARTPVGLPPPRGVAAELADRFDGRVADFLALRLVKGTDWPDWQVMGVLLYLTDQHLISPTAALVRFAAETKNEGWRKAAIEAIRAARDRDLAAKIAFERGRFKAQQKMLPKALEEMSPESRK